MAMKLMTQGMKKKLPAQPGVPIFLGGDECHMIHCSSRVRGDR
jgi:hypothetical protein